MQYGNENGRKQECQSRCRASLLYSESRNDFTVTVTDEHSVYGNMIMINFILTKSRNLDNSIGYSYTLNSLNG